MITLKLSCVIAFFITAFFAIVLNRAIFRKIFLIVSVSIFSFYGLAGGINWPFFSWHLYAIEMDDELTFYEFRLADDAGNEIKYDARALKPTITTPLRRLATNFVNLPSDRATELGDFIFTKGMGYRHQIESKKFSVFDLLKFPPHQFGFKWSDTNLKKIGEFKMLRVYEVNVKLEKSVVVRREDICRIDLQFN